MKKKWKLRGWLVSGWFVSVVLFIGMVTVGDAALAYNVSGTITNGSGKSGQTFVSVQYNGGGDTGLGTCLLAGTGSFTIRGAGPGTYVVSAWMDVNGSGTQNANEPAAASASFTVTNTDVTVGTIALNNPPPTSPLPVAGNQLMVIPGDNGALVRWKTPTDNNGREIADSYNIYWGTAANPGPGNTPGGGTFTVPARDDGHAFFGSTNGTAIYVAVEAVNSLGTSVRTSTGPVTIGPVSGGATVTGRVLSFGIAKSANTPLYIAVVNDSANPPAFFLARIDNPGDTQSWTVTGVTPGTYQVFAILDLDNNHYIGPGDVHNTNGQAPTMITVTGTTGVTAPDVTLSGVNSARAVNTNHLRIGVSESYNIDFRVREMMKLPVSATINSGPVGLSNFIPPYDLGVTSWGEIGYWLQNIGVRPSVGQSFNITVNYSDGTSETVNPQITAVLDNFAAPTFPINGVAPASVIPVFTFTWSAASPTPAFPFIYNLWLGSQYGGQVWSTDKGLPGSQLSVPFNADGRANPPQLSAGTQYNWGISVRDAQGNSASSGVGFMPMLLPNISGFNPPSGPIGASINISGSNFSPFSATDNTVTFAKAGGGTVAATVTNFSSNSLTVTVPAGVTSGPISVTTAGGSATSSGSFTLQYMLSATIAGTGGGTVYINPPGTPFSSGTASQSYNPGTPVTLTAAPSNSLLSWSGCDSATGTTCNVTMTTDKAVTATFTYVSPVLLDGVNKSSLQAAFDGAHVGSVVKARAYDFIESSLNLNNPVAFSLQGGYDLAYINIMGYSILHGILTIIQGSLTINNFVIQ